MAAKANDPLQEQLIQARRSQILDGATTVFAQKGFHRATIRDVATAAGIADGTIYNYFENKTALLLALLDRINQTEQRAQQFEQGAQMDLRQFFRAYLRQRYQIIGQNQFEVFQVALSEVLVNQELRDLYYKRIIEPTYALTEQFLLELIDAGAIKPFDVRLWMRMVAGVTVGMLVLHILGDSEVQAKWDDIPDFLADVILAGIEFTGEQP